MVLTENIVDSSKKSLDSFLAKKSKRNIIAHYKKIKSKMERNKNYKHFPVSLYSKLIVHAFEKKPDYFMREIYTELRSFLINSFDSSSLKNIERYILKKSTFHKNEKLVFELEGKFTNHFYKSGSKMIFDKSNIYITNKRIIIQSNEMKIGSIDTHLVSYGSNSYLLEYYKKMLFTRNTRQVQQRPCYGYDFSIYNLKDIKNDLYRVCYTYNDMGKENTCEIFPKNNHLVMTVKEALSEIKKDVPLDGIIRKHCEECGALIKVGKKKCKYCERNALIPIKSMK